VLASPTTPPPPRTPAHAASEFVTRWHGKLVDPSGALNETFRRTMDPETKGKAGGELHVQRTAAAKELGDLNHLREHPNEGALVIAHTVSQDVPWYSLIQPAPRFVDVQVYYGPTQAEAQLQSASWYEGTGHRQDPLYWFPLRK
jgi:hypothetical protein